MEYYVITAKVPMDGNEAFFTCPQNKNIKVRNRKAEIEVLRIYPKGRYPHELPCMMVRSGDGSRWHRCDLGLKGDVLKLVKALDKGDMSCLDLTFPKLDVFFAMQDFKLEYRTEMTSECTNQFDLMNRSFVGNKRVTMFTRKLPPNSHDVQPRTIFCAAIPVIFSPQTA